MKERSDIHSGSPSDERSLKQILQDIVNHISDIIRSEARLAKTEIRQDVSEYAHAGSFVGIAAVLGLFAIGFVLLSAVYALQLTLPLWLSALLVGVAVGIAAAILYVMGRKKLGQASLRPDQTIRSFKENVTWFKKQTK